uniref:Uncharacterized protein n=1 Tax=Chromera velia CCMP2878 TaxID=1169474 RepID=A0A0G4H9K3_9ALVE|eukprot:Cvel_25314.t1-p1 / transcript=Cvel_25314.t1 / gene=Cvel_25314 / organism=Chromera_velia_CCMP2878 / gene_product=hypothetical protein / transcript_product=hypothetical protein / location=Cvel_scaffold2850:1558-2764(+) / protein_length=194 / sequence_SO=supercontig / SO=protein_coding / is_pseudo=false
MILASSFDISQTSYRILATIHYVTTMATAYAILPENDVYAKALFFMHETRNLVNGILLLLGEMGSILATDMQNRLDRLSHRLNAIPSSSLKGRGGHPRRSKHDRKEQSEQEGSEGHRLPLPLPLPPPKKEKKKGKDVKIPTSLNASGSEAAAGPIEAFAAHREAEDDKDDCSDERDVSAPLFEGSIEKDLNHLK